MKKSFYDILEDVKRDAILAFDIETTTLNDNTNFMYVWQMAILNRKTKEENVIFGRTWKEVIFHLHRIKEVCNTEKKIYIYVHNLSYEFWYMLSIDGLNITSGLFTDVHKVLSLNCMDNIVFKCSYRLTGRSLAGASKAFNIIHKKKPEINYKEVFYPWTKLPHKVFEYCANDVLAVVEIVDVLLNQYNDSLDTIPLTATGYVRRDIQQALNENEQKKLAKIAPNYDVYKLLRRAFRGGDTHASRFYAGQIIDNVASYDRKSSYPSVQVCKKFPVTDFRKVEIKTIEEAVILNRRGSALLMEIAMWNIKTDDACPYLAISKCAVSENYTADNGRILTADKIVTVITDIDLRIILDQYKIGGVEILQCYYSKYGYLPDNYRNVIRKYYKGKCQLKGIAGAELEYMLSKGNLNSIYGMSATDPVRENYKIDFSNKEVIPCLDKLDREAIEDNVIAQLNASARKRKSGVYQWGVWTTAHARYELYQLRKEVGISFIYCDTDSVKFIKDLCPSDFVMKIKAYNKKWVEKSIKEKIAYPASDGEYQYIGTYENEGNEEGIEYQQFITWGAKKYAYVKNGEIGITIAGVPKKDGAIELQKRGGLESLKEGFTFTSIKKNRLDYVKACDAGTVEGIEKTNCIVFHHVDYQLGITNNYRELIERDKKVIAKILDIYKF